MILGIVVIIMSYTLLLSLAWIFLIIPDEQKKMICNNEFPDIETNSTQYALYNHCYKYPNTYGVKP